MREDSSEIGYCSKRVNASLLKDEAMETLRVNAEHQVVIAYHLPQISIFINAMSPFSARIIDYSTISSSNSILIHITSLVEKFKQPKHILPFAEPIAPIHSDIFEWKRKHLSGHDRRHILPSSRECKNVNMQKNDEKKP